MPKFSLGQNCLFWQDRATADGLQYILWSLAMIIHSFYKSNWIERGRKLHFTSLKSMNEREVQLRLKSTYTVYTAYLFIFQLMSYKAVWKWSSCVLHYITDLLTQRWALWNVTNIILCYVFFFRFHSLSCSCNKTTSGCLPHVLYKWRSYQYMLYNVSNVPY